MTNENDIIDSVMSDAKEAQDAPKVDDAAQDDQPVVENDTEEEGDKDPVQESDEQGSDDKGGDSDSGDDLPKNVKKALDKNKRYIRNLREREKALLSEIEKLKSQEYKPKEIKEEEFEGSYGDFIEQRAIEKMRAELGQNQQKQQLDQLTLQQQQLMQEQTQVIQQEAMEYAKQSEEFAKIVPESAAKFDVLPPETQNLFFELESPSLAAYALAKEGKIEQLAHMSPYMAAQEIYGAQARGQKYLQSSSKKQVSNAPAPVKGTRGGSNNNPTEKTIVDGLMKELYS